MKTKWRQTFLTIGLGQAVMEMPLEGTCRGSRVSLGDSDRKDRRASWSFLAAASKIYLTVHSFPSGKGISNVVTKYHKQINGLSNRNLLSPGSGGQTS